MSQPSRSEITIQGPVIKNMNGPLSQEYHGRIHNTLQNGNESICSNNTRFISLGASASSPTDSVSSPHEAAVQGVATIRDKLANTSLSSQRQIQTDRLSLSRQVQDPALDTIRISQESPQSATSAGSASDSVRTCLDLQQVTGPLTNADLARPSSSTALGSSVNIASNYIVNAGQYIEQAHAPVSSNSARIDYHRILKRMERMAVVDALHNASVRKSIHQDTRGAVMTRLESWFYSDAEDGPRVFWLHGGVGVGKSAIAQTMCNKLSRLGELPSKRKRLDEEESQDKEGEAHSAPDGVPVSLLAVGYFFSRTQTTDRRGNSARALIQTIVYRLAAADEKYRERVAQVLYTDYNLLNEVAETIFDKLFLRLLANADYPTARLIVIDGLDECLNAEEAKSILRMIFQFLRSSRPNTYKFLLCSRTMEWLRLHLIHDDNNIRVDSFELGGPLDQTIKSDIERFLRSRFAEAEGIDPDFQPTDAEIAQVVQKAGVQFVYAQAVADHVCQETDTGSAQMFFQDILHLDASSGDNPYTSLDVLYQGILRRTKRDHETLLRLILTPPLHADKPRQTGLSGETLTLEIRENIVTHPTCWLIANRLGLPAIVIQTRLKQLESVVCGKKKDKSYDNHTSIIFRHASFVDFLARQSIQPYTDGEVHAHLAQCCVRRATQYCSAYKDSTPGSELETSRRSEGQMEMWRFDGHALNFWLHHCKQSIMASQEPGVMVAPSGVVNALNGFDPYAYVMTALRMDDWQHPFYNPTRYQDRTEFIWEWVHRVFEACEWAKTLSDPPLDFIASSELLLTSGLTIVSRAEGVQDPKHTVIDVMFTFFLANAHYQQWERDLHYERWVEQLPTTYHYNVEDIVEQARAVLTFTPRGVGDSTMSQRFVELQQNVSMSDLGPLEYPKCLKRSYRRILERKMVTDPHHITLIEAMIQSVHGEYEKVKKRKADRRKALYEETCHHIAKTILDWKEKLDQKSKGLVERVSELEQYNCSYEERLQKEKEEKEKAKRSKPKPRPTKRRRKDGQ